MSGPPAFLPAALLVEHDLAAAFQRAEQLAEGEVEGLETRGQARAFLQEVQGVVHGLGEAGPAAWHPRVLQAGLSLLRATLDFNTGQLAEAEAELGLAAEGLAGLEDGLGRVVAARCHLMRARVAWEQGRWPEAEARLLQAVDLAATDPASGLYSLQDLARWEEGPPPLQPQPLGGRPPALRRPGARLGPRRGGGASDPQVGGEQQG
jgi:hypothetical protein